MGKSWVRGEKLEDETVRRETGRVFHDRAAATVNTRSPRLDRLVAGTNRVTDIQATLIRLLDYQRLICIRLRLLKWSTNLCVFDRRSWLPSDHTSRRQTYRRLHGAWQHMTGSPRSCWVCCNPTVYSCLHHTTTQHTGTTTRCHVKRTAFSACTNVRKKCKTWKLLCINGV